MCTPVSAQVFSLRKNKYTSNESVQGKITLNSTEKLYYHSALSFTIMQCCSFTPQVSGNVIINRLTISALMDICALHYAYGSVHFLNIFSLQYDYHQLIFYEIIHEL